jgi:uncharacterized protein
VTGATPLPVPDERSAPYWEAAGRHRLVIAICSRCARRSHPPDSVCPHCRHADPRFRFKEVSGGGTVRSWVVVRRSFLPGFEVPFVLVDVEIDEDAAIRLIGRLVDGPDEPLATGARVRVCFDDLAPGVSVPSFELERPR